MGKVISKTNGRPSVIQFSGDKCLSITVDGQRVKVEELGFMDAVVEVVGEKDISLLEPIIKAAVESPDLFTAKRKIRILYAEGERRTVHENQVKSVESFEEAEHIKVDVAAAKLDFDLFKHMWDSVNHGKPRPQMSISEGKTQIFLAVKAYCDKSDHDHDRMVKFLEKAEFQSFLAEPKDGLCVLRFMYPVFMLGFKLNRETEQQLKQDFREYIKNLRLDLEEQFYEPIPYPNDIDRAEEYMDAAMASMEKGDINHAIHVGEEAIKAAVNLLDAYYLLTQAYVMRKDYERAMETLEKVTMMPMADRILRTRRDYYALYESLMGKIQSLELRQRYFDRLRELKEKHGIL